MPSDIRTGFNCKVGIVVGATPEYAIPSMNWKLKDDRPIADGHNAVDGTLRVKSGREDWSGSVEGVIDVDAPIWGKIKGGDIATIKLYTAEGVTFYSFTGIWESPEFGAEMDEVQKFSASFKLQSGVMTYPV